MTGSGKHRNDAAVSPFPPTLEIALRFPHYHHHDHDIFDRGHSTGKRNKR